MTTRSKAIVMALTALPFTLIFAGWYFDTAILFWLGIAIFVFAMVG
jgi:hypothetical protein